MDGEHVSLSLELAVGSDPISGRVRGARVNDQSFHGWLELAALLEHERGAEPGTPPTGEEDGKE
jgi:hypothetical protein